MECTEEHCTSIESKTVTTVEVEGCSYFVLRKDEAKGDRRSDDRLMADFFKGVDVERVKKKRMMYDPSHRTVRKIPKQGNKEEGVVLLNVLAENAVRTNEGSAKSMGTERQSPSKHHEKGKRPFQDKEK
jgi:hypothetical protein